MRCTRESHRQVWLEHWGELEAGALLHGGDRQQACELAVQCGSVQCSAVQSGYRLVKTSSRPGSTTSPKPRMENPPQGSPM